jgi:ABC-type multidrug transport system ATPase subunit
MQELYIDSVDHRYGDRQVLNGVYLTCKISESVGLLGLNGSGKSTLLKVIFGSLWPHHKYMKINDELVQRGYLTRQISYLPQGFFIPHYLKIKTLIACYINRYKERLLEIAVIKTNQEEEIGNLSGGNRRLVEALLILYSDAPFILLDEPFSQLAPLIADELKIHMQHFKTEKGFIITDHYYQQILEISDRVVLMHNGSNYTINNEDDLRLYGYLPS